MTEGESLFLQGKIDEAYEVLEKEKTGRALYLLGLIEREGYGHRKADEEKSRQFFEEGKKQGDPLCSVALFQGETGKNMWDTVNQDFSRVLLSANHGDVLAMDHVFGGTAAAIIGSHQHDRVQGFAVAGLHPRQEGGKGRAADLAHALVEVMGDLFGQAIQHAGPVATVERIVVTLQQGQRGGARGGISHGRIQL